MPSSLHMLGFRVLLVLGCTADLPATTTAHGGAGGDGDLTTTNGYRSSAAVAYADANWDDGVGLCAQFVSDSLRAGSLEIDEITYVPTLVAALGDIPYEEHLEGDTPSAAAGDVVVYSDATGDAFCDDDSDEFNCGHTCIVSTGGQGEDTITVDCHNNAHYQLPLGYILGDGYSTYRVYHLQPTPPNTVACSTDYDCNRGQPGTQDVCASGEDYCIKACHSDFDCPSGTTCEQTEPHWSCR